MKPSHLYPSPFNANMTTKKAKFFMNGSWILVGDITLTCDKNCMSVMLPDIGVFLESREYLDDGTFDWAEWGPRLN